MSMDPPDTHIPHPAANGARALTPAQQPPWMLFGNMFQHPFQPHPPPPHPPAAAPQHLLQHLPPHLQHAPPLQQQLPFQALHPPQPPHHPHHHQHQRQQHQQPPHPHPGPPPWNPSSQHPLNGAHNIAAFLQQMQIPAHSASTPAPPSSMLPFQHADSPEPPPPTVGSSPDDEVVLAQVLHECTAQGLTYKAALETLHHRHGYPAFQWKDYYLEHKQRVDAAVALLAAPSSASSRQGSVAQSSKQALAQRDSIEGPHHPKLSKLKRASSARSHSPESSKASSAKAKQAEPSPHVLSAARSFSASVPGGVRAGTRRTTINSLTSYRPTTALFGITIPHADIPIPEPPSRSPTPPTKVVAGTKGNLFTTEDKEYLIHFIQWRLKGDPSLTKKELCEALTEKAPHHSATSWGTYWSREHDLPDKILADAHRRADEEESSSESSSDDGSSSEEGGYVPQKRTTNGKTTDAVRTQRRGRGRPPLVAKSQVNEDKDDSDQDSEDDAEGEDDEEAEDDDPWKMGQAGQRMTKGDFLAMGKWVEQHHNWKDLTNRERWGPFHKKYPQRSAASWGEAYRRYDKEIEASLREDRERGRDGGDSDQSLSPPPPLPVSPSLPTSNLAEADPSRHPHSAHTQYPNAYASNSHLPPPGSTAPRIGSVLAANHSPTTPTSSWSRDLPHAPPPHLKRKFHEERIEAHELDKRPRTDGSGL